MSTIDLYQVLRKIPAHRIETDLAELRAEFRTTSSITLALLLALLAIQLATLLQ